MRYHSEEFEKHALNEIKANISNGGRVYNAQQRELMWNEANEIIILKDSTKQLDIETLNQSSGTSHTNGQLMVDKYRPKKYFDLLSDETTNRSLLQWIKLFDKVVFNREVQTKKNAKPGELSNFNKKTGRFEQNGGWQKRKQKGNLNTELDEHGCPTQKIALLCGR